jgi:hypothetical protein
MALIEIMIYDSLEKIPDTFSTFGAVAFAVLVGFCGCLAGFGFCGPLFC